MPFDICCTEDKTQDKTQDHMNEFLTEDVMAFMPFKETRRN